MGKLAVLVVGRSVVWLESLVVLLYSRLVQVNISYRIYWRRSYIYRTECTADWIVSGQLSGPETPGYLMCISGCSRDPTSRGITVSGVDIQCKSFSVYEDWMYGERTVTYNFSFGIVSKYLLELVFFTASNCHRLHKETPKYLVWRDQLVRIKSRQWELQKTNLT